MAYIDARAGEPVLLLHPIPTWSFLHADATSLIEPPYRVPTGIVLFPNLHAMNRVDEVVAQASE